MDVMGAMNTILANLGDLLKDEYKLQKSVRDNISFLEAELKAMQPFLARMSEAPIDQPLSDQDKVWSEEVRELSYDLEDKIDEFLVRIDSPEQFSGLCAFVRRIIHLSISVIIRHKLGSHINDLKTRITQVSERHKRYRIDNGTAEQHTCPSVDHLRQSALYKMASELIGTEEKANDLVEKLSKDNELSNQQPKVFSIVGMGGLGKTTLANAMYEKLKCHFDCGAFVSISQNPKMDQVFKKMLRELDIDSYRNTNGESLDEMQLINELRRVLRDKRFCVVVDDIWNKSVWNSIFCALNSSRHGSIIITTTRILDVAEHTGSGEFYKLNPLSPADSRKLFNLRIFGNEKKCLPKELAEVSDNILRKCGGVPLAILTVASMLGSRKEPEYACEYWSKVCKSMGSGLEDSSDHVRDMRRILAVSYHDLPLHLRICFLYLSFYPEDYLIGTEDLVWKWICEGFVTKKPGKNMLEVGEDYINELISRSLIQPTDSGNENRKTCSSFKIHDMVLDLITFMCNKEQFLTKLGAQEPESPNKIRRLSLQTSNEEDDKELEKKNLSHVRSLIVFSVPFNLPLKQSRFPFLRLLDLTRVKVGDLHFKDICNLLYLRYLALPYNSITEIPKEIGKLKFLKVLKIDGTKIVQLPSSFVQLRQLAYLEFGNLVTVPDWFGYLKSLQEIRGHIHVKSPTTLQVLGELTEVRCVSLHFEEWDESYEKLFHLWLSRVVSLKYLAIMGEMNMDLGTGCDKLSPGPQQLESIYIHSTACSVPRWMSSLCSLSILHICLLTLEDADLQILGSIPSLSHLDIKVKERLTHGPDRNLVVINAHSFFGLKKFTLDKTIGVVFMKGAMDKLRSLVLYFGVRETMDHLGHFNFGLKNLISLVEVKICMDLTNAQPQEVKTAVATIQNEIDMNPNICKQQITQRAMLKLNVNSERQRSIAMAAVARLDGCDSVAVAGDHRDKLYVRGRGMMDLTTAIETMKKKGILATASFL